MPRTPVPKLPVLRMPMLRQAVLTKSPSSLKGMFSNITSGFSSSTYSNNRFVASLVVLLEAVRPRVPTPKVPVVSPMSSVASWAT